MRPYSDQKVGDHEAIRTFNESIDPVELMWHRDDEDREVEAIGSTDWLIQLENELPRQLTSRINIPRHEWHRLIKGTGDLTIRIIKK